MVLLLAPQPQPKILSVVTVPTGGWDLTLKITESSSLDTQVDITVPAGDYFMAWDHQDDDFIHELQNQINAGIVTASSGFVGGSITNAVHIWIDSDHYVNVDFDADYFQGSPQQIVSIEWSGTDIGAVCGFLSNDNDMTDNVTFTADVPHAYGWYADFDGAIANDMTHDVSEFKGTQVFTMSGQSKVQKLALQYHNMLDLQYIPESKMWSNDVGYTEAPVYPYARNEPLECWWQEAHQGKRFRVYRDGQIDTTRFADTGAVTSDTTTQLTDSNKSWPASPYRWTGRILYVPDHTKNTDNPQRWYITGGSATTVTVNAVDPATPYDIAQHSADQVYYLLEQPYKTYVVDLDQMPEFAPTEHPHINEYSLKIPLRKYVA